MTADGETIEVTRRFKEFNLLRKTFVQRHPALYIPPIPLKKAVNNTNIDLVEER